MNAASLEDFAMLEAYEHAAHREVTEPAAPTADQTSPRARLAPMHWRDLDGHQHRRVGLVSGLLDVGTMSLIYGAPGCGKTFIAIDLALHVASGRAWRDRPVHRGPVVYVAAEGGVGLSDRVDAARAHLGLSFDDADLYVIGEQIDLCSSDRDVDLLLEHIRALPARPVAIFIDTLSRALAGGDENSSVDMGGFIRRIDKLRLETGAHVAVIHHPGKTSEREARGHFSLKGAVDTEILIKSTGSRRGSMTVTKQRDQEDGQAFGFLLKVIEIGGGEDGDIHSSCAVEHAEINGQTARNPVLSEVDLLVLDALREAVRQSGHPARNLPNVPDGVDVIRAELWKLRALNRDVSAGKPASKAQAFNRAKKKLTDLGTVGEASGHVWLADETPPAP
ncbi:MAG: AAA family ATPase [Rhizobiales bacterium]|nr:AAA family ATPase [Hyphomicrobiales bacterium]